MTNRQMVHSAYHQKIFITTFNHSKVTVTVRLKFKKLGRFGLVVRAVACEASEPGFDSSSDQMVFLLRHWRKNRWIQTR